MTKFLAIRFYYLQYVHSSWPLKKKSNLGIFKELRFSTALCKIRCLKVKKFVCLLEWMPSRRKESGYSIIRNFASCSGLVLMAMVNPGNRKSIHTSLVEVNHNTAAARIQTQYLSHNQAATHTSADWN